MEQDPEDHYKNLPKEPVEQELIPQKGRPMTASGLTVEVPDKKVESQDSTHEDTDK